MACWAGKQVFCSSPLPVEGCSQSHIDPKGLCLPGQSVTIRDGTCKSTPELNLVASTYSPVNVLNCSKQRPLHKPYLGSHTLKNMLSLEDHHSVPLSALLKQLLHLKNLATQGSLWGQITTTKIAVFKMQIPRS